MYFGYCLISQLNLNLILDVCWDGCVCLSVVKKPNVFQRAFIEHICQYLGSTSPTDSVSKKVQIIKEI